jgi:hypothetical protein
MAQTERIQHRPPPPRRPRSHTSCTRTTARSRILIGTPRRRSGMSSLVRVRCGVCLLSTSRSVVEFLCSSSCARCSKHAQAALRTEGEVYCSSFSLLHTYNVEVYGAAADRRAQASTRGSGRGTCAPRRAGGRCLGCVRLMVCAVLSLVLVFFSTFICSYLSSHGLRREADAGGMWRSR